MLRFSAQQGQPHVKGCKNWNYSERDRFDDVEAHNAETIPGYKRRKWMSETEKKKV